jgi:4-azaleucine resistance transporter AzlC
LTDRLLTDVRAGIRQAFAVVLGYVPVGFAFGVLAVQNGIPPWAAVLISVIVYAGSAQLIAAGLIGAGASAATVVLTTLVVNLRHMLMSAALAPWLSGLARRTLVVFGLELTDETFALHNRSRAQGRAPVPATLLACNLAAHVSWIAGTLIGVFAGGLLGDTRAFGLDFTLAAMFIALLVPQCLDRLHLFAALASALLCTILVLLGADRWAVVLSTAATACLAGWLSGLSRPAAKGRAA